jgi:hypothetical protein
MLNEMARPSSDDDFRYFMELTQSDPERAGQEFLQRLQSGKQTAKSRKAAMQLERILSGDETAWQHGSASMADAVQFLISNTLMGGMGLGVFRPGMESLVKDVASMISEDVDFNPMSPMQKRMKQIAESYGYGVYLIQ